MENSLKQSEYKVIRVAIVGPESTGKTTLARALAAHYSTVYAGEYMREYFTKVAPRIPFESHYNDLLPIAKGQVQTENRAAAVANKLLFCDTNLLELKCYADYYFGACPEPIEQAIKTHAYDLTFLTYIDVPWEQDELRDRPLARQKLFTIFEQALNDYRIPHTLLMGNEQDRLTLAIKTIDHYCQNLDGI